MTAVAVLTAVLGLSAAALAQGAAPANCVTIGTPKPTLTYTYQFTAANGSNTRRTERWENVTTTGSRVRVSRNGGTEISINEHRVVDDAIVIDRNSKQSANGGVIEATAFRPGMVGDIAFRACAARSWKIPSVTANYQSRQNKASAASASGALTIVAVNEKIAVPAGQFDTVHYVRTSQSRDEYWKSIEHGVIVKHIATLPGVPVMTDVLMSIK